LALLERGLATSVFMALAEVIRQRSQAYVQKYADVTVEIGTILFDRKGDMIGRTASAERWLNHKGMGFPYTQP
jgi:cobalt-precorrin-5B (C1)-methyltransferase